MSEDGELGNQGNCLICNFEKPKYKCPKCEERTCSLQCCKMHKQQCDGQRDPTAKGSTCQQDFNFLQDTMRKTEIIQKRLIGITCLPDSLRYKLLKQQAKKLYEADLRLAPKFFQRHLDNLSFYSVKQKLIYWTLEFKYEDILICISDPISSQLKMSEILDQVDLFSSEVLQKYSRNLGSMSKEQMELSWFSKKVSSYSEQQEYKFNNEKRKTKRKEKELEFEKQDEIRINLNDNLEQILKGMIIYEYPTFYIKIN